MATQEIPIEIISPDRIEAIFVDLNIEIDPAKLAGKNIAVDLDDTLLFGSITISNLWSMGAGYADKTIVDGYAYARMKKSLRGHYNAWRGRPKYDQACRQANPFLANPRVVVVLNMPLVSVLNWMKTCGANLSLVTASARHRMDNLKNRLPILEQLFEGRVMAAEDIAERLLSIETGMGPNVNETTWNRSAKMHAHRPNSLAAKSPWLVSSLYDGQSFDMLLDDSNVTHQLFQQSGLENCLFRIHHHDLDRRKLWIQALQFGAGLSPDEPLPASASNFPEFQDTLIEDPLYWPLLHKDDQLDWGR
jgi:phosphoserine phosphatase